VDSRYICEKCRFWKLDPTSDPDEPFGECRRHAPLPKFYTVSDDRLQADWPLTHCREWCGEFQPLPLVQVMVPKADA